MLAEERTRTGRTKGNSVNSVWGAGNSTPKFQAKLYLFSPFPHPPSRSRGPGSHNHRETPWAQRRWKPGSVRAGPLVLKWPPVQEALFPPQHGAECTTVLFGF